jgi:hypothetical protein
VYTPQIVQRISEAEKNDSITKVIDITDVRKGNITAQNETNTWKFKADSVTDFCVCNKQSLYVVCKQFGS